MKNIQNQRNTKQRQIILEHLRKLSTHPTATELYHLVRKQLPKISLGTVYRNLELLLHNKTIQKIEMQGSQARFDGEVKPHHHARCIQCGAVDDLFDLPDDIVRSEFKQLDDYDVRGYRIEFFGLCPKCQLEQKEN